MATVPTLYENIDTIWDIRKSVHFAEHKKRKEKKTFSFCRKTQLSFYKYFANKEVYEI